MSFDPLEVARGIVSWMRSYERRRFLRASPVVVEASLSGNGLDFTVEVRCRVSIDMDEDGYWYWDARCIDEGSEAYESADEAEAALGIWMQRQAQSLCEFLEEAVDGYEHSADDGIYVFRPLRTSEYWTDKSVLCRVWATYERRPAPEERAEGQNI
ncbi:MAG: hypothetical protein QXU26_02660 [Thermofilaceae archaeon]